MNNTFTNTSIIPYILYPNNTLSHPVSNLLHHKRYSNVFIRGLPIYRPGVYRPIYDISAVLIYRRSYLFQICSLPISL